MPTGGSHSLPSSSSDISGWLSRSLAISSSAGGRLSSPYAASNRPIASTCREAAVTGPAGGVAITGRPEFSLQVLPYTLEDLCAARHSDELTRADLTEVHIDYRQHGIGSESCCTTLPLCYRFEEKNFTFAFRLKIV